MSWHAALTGLWALARIARRFPDLAAGEEAAGLLADRLTGATVAAEQAALEADPTLGRPAGWAWLLRLDAELEGWARAGSGEAAEPAPAPRRAVDALGPLTDLAARRLSAWATSAGPHPRRGGSGSNSALALALALPPARAGDHGRLPEQLVSLARRWYLPDVDAPVAYEPSAGEVVSPVLVETHLLGSVLDPPDFADWYEAFLPGTADVVPPRLGDPPVLGDPDDPVAARRHTLTASRAWSWRGIARALPRRDERRAAALDAADRHLGAALEAVPADTLEVDHRAPAWLVLACG